MLLFVFINAVSMWMNELRHNFLALDSKFRFSHKKEGGHYTKSRTLGNSVQSLTWYF